MNIEEDKMSAHIPAFSDLLITLRAELGNDLDLVLIMAVISERHYARANHAPGINALSLAMYADIPRETVRRKVAKLIGKGWVKCNDQGILSPTPQAAIDLANGTAATLRYLSAVRQPTGH
ncbi:hypothetical protein [Marinobacter sp. S6332]|uniref:hypothetical protein n=1 Tax=Marinobacter sp. S6332 TaxID=2926403 RepID=UPI001FF455B8|nr:hypothetical protein [Marinobacter sp. S6332]MCK0163257.1 hypothetical protein [Marinobacter sp. S6332]